MLSIDCMLTVSVQSEAPILDVLDYILQKMYIINFLMYNGGSIQGVWLSSAYSWYNMPRLLETVTITELK